MDKRLMLTVVCLLWAGLFTAGTLQAHEYTNSLGMKMLRIEHGSFEMGSTLGRDYWDEQPVHKVTISKAFYISEIEVTAEQFRQFKSEFCGTARYLPYAAGVSWYEAVAFCEWLSGKEGKAYRLPTEAEWEYACRAGTTMLYWSGDNPPRPGKANPWGLKNMHTGVREWCLDWHGEYPAAEQVDPVGPEYGMARVVRGGLLDDGGKNKWREIFNASSSRAAIAPGFGPYYNESPANKPVKKEEPGEEAEEQVEDLSKRVYQGLTGIKYGNKAMNSTKGQLKLDTLDKVWTGGDNDWSARWFGYIEAPQTGEVAFYGEADNGMLLQIDGKSIINAWDDNAQPQGKMSMVEGKKYPIVLSYYKDGGASYLKLYWSRADKEKEVVPIQVLTYTGVEAQMTNVKDDDDDDDDENEEMGVPGYHNIGFRVVQGPTPSTRPLAYQASYVQQGVKQNKDIVKKGPDRSKPYFRKRYLLPTPPETCEGCRGEEIDAAGLHPSFRGHNHSPALEVCPNGDVLMVSYTSYAEYEPTVSLIASRLRFGADQWDMPDKLFDFVTVNDHAPMLWTDTKSGIVYFFWGNPRLEGGFPFQWTSSKDNGATWAEVQFPNFMSEIGSHSRQPINTAVRDKNGTLYVASDGDGSESVLWETRDNCKTWYDTGGRTFGRHTTFALLSDGTSILGMGGKKSDIDGFMPRSLTRDSGKSYEVSKTPFCRLGSNQRPSLLRLSSGRLLMAGDFNERDGGHPASITEKGSYVALSNDDGENWLIKKLPGAQLHEDEPVITIGYSAARQGPDGMIHLITSMNKPSLHFAFNEAWILAKDTRQEKMSDAELMKNTASSISRVKAYRENYPDSKKRIEFSGGIGDDGRFLLHGRETWYYPDGTRQREGDYAKGRKVATETYWSRDGKKKWTWVHKEDGRSVWTQYWPNGRKKAESTWKNFKCEGTSTVWDNNGKVISRNEFANGRNIAQMNIAGTLIIESTESITGTSNSILNGPGATITVNGGSFTINGRFNVGMGSDGYISMNGGTFTVTGTLKFPDGDGGVHRIYLNDGIMHAGDIEQQHDRDAIIYVGGGILRLDDITGGGGDPQVWKDNGDLLPAEGYDDIVIEDCGDYTEVRANIKKDVEDDDEDEGDTTFPKIEIPQGNQHECVEKHLVVYDEPGRYAGWPANGGFWIRMAVSFECGWFKDKPDWEDGHARDNRSNEDIVTHSSDGGLTWIHKTYPALSGDDGMVPLTEEMDFSRDGFGFKSQGSRFYYTYDYGLSWAGPFKLNIQGRPFDDDDIESHTCYLVTGPKEGYFFFGIEPDGAQDKFYCAKTTDGGKSFQFLGWISPSIEDAPKYERWAVYSAVEVEKSHLIAALRRKISKRRGKIQRLNWIDVYQSKDAGKTWSFLSKVADTDVVNSNFNGNPPSVIKLNDGRLALTYGFRGRPTALCAKLSSDNGRSWGEPIILRRGSRNWDFGYSRSLQREDGKVFTVYYWATPEHRNQYIAGTIWDSAKVK
ncbi:MAG: SUMF1/EgtB/PvdO family nonheme iron enzyme [Planctomycetota bacterium]|jgi:antitoxin component YwqK of YwqJK toxin-antitoxin module